MNEPIWLDKRIVIDIHAEQLALFGGPSGVRDHGALESALARSENKFAYGEFELCALAAAYGFGIAPNHPFVDGNKRTVLAAMIVFLGLNRLRLVATEEATTAAILALAAGELEEPVLAAWLVDNVAPSA